MGKYYPAEVDALLLPWLAQHTMAELAALALEHNLIVSPVRVLAEVLATERSG
jgi:crotonobetainyl-CoA:carnitine CoA-transferase CaiB-like acyl-CoA transferase